jgi:hypothetical protein
MEMIFMIALAIYAVFVLKKTVFAWIEVRRKMSKCTNWKKAYFFLVIYLNFFFISVPKLFFRIGKKK